MQSVRNTHRIVLSALGIAVAAGFAAAPAFAQDATTTASGKHFAVVGGYAHQEPTGNGDIDGSEAEFDGSGAGTLGLSYYLNDNIAIEGWGAINKFDHRVTTAADGKIATVSSQPYALSAQYHFREADATVRPFVGLGYFEANTDGEQAEPAGALAGERIGVETAKGAMATAGVDLNINPTWFARADVRYLQDTTGQPNVAVDGVNVGKAELNPVVLGVGIGARF